MVFSNLFFLFAFLPTCLVFYYIMPKQKLKDIVLILFSLFFYAWGEPIWVSLLIISATVDYIHGRIIESTDKQWQKRLMLLSSIVINLGLLSIFKYSAFFIQSLNTVFNLDLIAPTFSLPIGISFYTFQTLSYTVDVYRGEVKAQKSFLSFLLFVSLFHQLVAGPIVRYKDIAKEIEIRVLSWERFNKGVLRFVIGLGKKVIIANTAGDLARVYLDQSFSKLTVMGSWTGILLFALQIYFDFSGYSDMAIGLGHMFGFTYKENFNYPYISRSATEFWRRWHISLGSFFRDYVYIPLGGNRKRRFLNLGIVWFLTGLWHGASWNFVMWGLYYGVLIVIEKQFLLKVLDRLPKFINHLYLVIAVLLGWVLFYYTDLNQGILYMKTMLGLTGAKLFQATDILRIKSNAVFLLLSIIFCMPFLKQLYKKVQHKLSHSSFVPSFLDDMLKGVFVLTVLTISTALILGQSYNPFIYFRF